MQLEEALEYANQVIFAIADLCQKIEVAGSIRRKKPEVHDIDLVVIPRVRDHPFNVFTWDAIATRLKKELKMKLIRKGKKLMTLGFKDVDLPVDIYRATPETWGVLLLIRTGSKEHNTMLCNKALRCEMKLSAAQGVIKDNKVIASRTEEEIFKALQMDYVPPEKREV